MAERVGHLGPEHGVGEVEGPAHRALFIALDHQGVQPPPTAICAAWSAMLRPGWAWTLTAAIQGR